MRTYYGFISSIIILTSCGLEHDSPNPQASTTIIESKERGVFNVSLNFERKTLAVGDQEIKIESIWIEDVWFHDKLRRSESKQIVVKVGNPNALDSFMSSWGISIADANYGSSNGNITIDLGLDTARSYMLYLFKYEKEYDIRSRVIIDSLQINKIP